MIEALERLDIYFFFIIWLLDNRTAFNRGMNGKFVLQLDKYLAESQIASVYYVM